MSEPRPVTKEELRQELERFATKDDLKQTAERLGLAWSDTNRRIDKLEESIQSSLSEGFRSINGRIDGFLNKLAMYDRETETFPKTLDDHGALLRNHEQRITDLERKP